MRTLWRSRRGDDRLSQALRARHLAGIALVEEASAGADFAAPDPTGLPDSGSLIEIEPERLSAGLLRAGILARGCVLVRGLIPRARAERFARQIDRTYAERELHSQGRRHDRSYYCEFEPTTGHGEDLGRGWVKQGGGVLAVDSPVLSGELLDLLRDSNLTELVEEYLGEPALITGQKTTLRIAEPTVAGAWHQDGKFMGPVRALNLWVALCRCGDEAPGLDLVPRRLEQYVATETDEAMYDHMVSQRQAQEAAGDSEILRPIFEPGDAVLFDELFLHKTGSDPSMHRPRYAIENWFFGASGFPSDYAPLAV